MFLRHLANAFPIQEQSPVRASLCIARQAFGGEKLQHFQREVRYQMVHSIDEWPPSKWTIHSRQQHPNQSTEVRYPRHVQWSLN